MSLSTLQQQAAAEVRRQICGHRLPEDLTLLESQAVSKAIAEDYQQRFDSLLLDIGRRDPSIENAEEVQQRLLMYFTKKVRTEQQRSRRVQGFRSFRTFLSNVWKAWSGKIGKGEKVATGMASPHANSREGSTTLLCHSSNCHQDLGSDVGVGSGSASWHELLSEAGRNVESEEQRFDTASSHSRESKAKALLVSAISTPAQCKAHKDRCLGGRCAHQSHTAIVDGAFARAFQATSARQQPLALQRKSLQKLSPAGLSGGRSKGLAAHLLPMPAACRGKLGHIGKPKGPIGSSKKRQVALGKERHQVRQSKQKHDFVRKPAQKLPAAFGTLRGCPIFNHSGTRAGPTCTWLKPGSYFLDIFGGLGCAAQRVACLGPTGIVVDLCDNFDITDGTNLTSILEAVRSGKVIGTCLAPPCESFSGARRAPEWSSMPHKLRENEHVMGLLGFSGKDLEALKRGNLLFNVAMRIIECCIDNNVP